MSSPSQPTLFSTHLSESLMTLGRAVAGGHMGTIAKALFNHPELRELLIRRVVTVIDDECSVLCRHSQESPSPFRKINLDQLHEFRWSHYIHELESKSPVFLQVLKTIESHSDHRNQKKRGDWHNTGICMSAATILKERTREMCGLQTILSLVLFSNRVQKHVRKANAHTSLK